MAPRFLDMDCTNETCGFQYRDEFFATVPNVVQCPKCHFPMRHVFLPRKQHRTAWSDADAVVVFRNPDGSYQYPAVNSKPTPKGCERIVMRSLREVEAFEKRSGTRSEMAWYDKGSGRGFDDHCQGETI